MNGWAWIDFDFTFHEAAVIFFNQKYGEKEERNKKEEKQRMRLMHCTFMPRNADFTQKELTQTGKQKTWHHQY